MPLTAVQIKQLYQFSRQHYVEWYDLQSELVDHLANAIETLCQENPKLTFDEALNIEFKKFGVFGFMDVVEKRQLVLSKKYNRLVWQHFRDFFGVPKIVLTIAMTLGFFNILKINPYREGVFMGLYLILIGFVFYNILNNRKNRRKKKQSGQKKWLFEEIINQYGNVSGAIILPLNVFIQIANHSDKILTNEYWILGISFFLVLMAIFIFIIFQVIPSKAEVYLKATYPDYKLVKP